MRNRLGSPARMLACAAIAAVLLPLAAFATLKVAPGIALVPGTFERGHQPDGNSILLSAPDGLILIDSGRHAAQIEAIRAAADGGKIAAIVNTHWHLDHVSGNIALKRDFPEVKVYASDAIDGALKGFLADGAKQAEEALAAGGLDPAIAAEVRGDLLTVRQGAALRPDVVIRKSGRMTIAGRALDVHLARNAATAGDIWLVDPATRTAIVGDLVTLPAPFLDTACPVGWMKALDEVARTHFTRLIPGHGPEMTPGQFSTWQGGFYKLIECAKSAADPGKCGEGWAADAAPLISAGDSAVARSMAAAYTKLIRAGGLDRYCPRA